MTSLEKKGLNKTARLSDSIYRLGPLGDPPVLSSYLVVDTKVAIIDCGPASVIDELISLMDECGIAPSQVDYLALTHIHLDHAGGSASFLSQCPKAVALIPERGFKHMLDPSVLNASSRPILGEQIFNSWGACEPVPREKALSVKAHEKANLGNIELEYIPATGHAPHHNVIADSRDSVIFCADALGTSDTVSGSLIPTTPPPSFNFDQAIEDIETIKRMQPELTCLAHFGEVEPTHEFFERVISVYKSWSFRTSRYIGQVGAMEYGLSDYEQIFLALEEDYPEYRNLSQNLREQVLRVDIGGMLGYFAKLKTGKTRTR